MFAHHSNGCDMIDDRYDAVCFPFASLPMARALLALAHLYVALYRGAAERLRQRLAAADVLARAGGNRFPILLSGLSPDPAITESIETIMDGPASASRSTHATAPTPKR